MSELETIADDDQRYDSSDENNVDDEGEDIFNMSDEDLNAYFANKQSQQQSEETTDGLQEKGQEANAEEEVTEEEEETDDEDSTDTDTGTAKTGESEDSGSDETNSDSSDEGDGDSEGSEADESGEEETDSSNAKSDSEGDSEVDYKSELENALQPFKANGRMIKVDSIQDLRTLAQMGANYNKKMAGLKPSLKIVKMLEQNDLLDEQKISHLIDISKKDPNAIGKLLKDADIDPMDLDRDSDEVAAYRPKDHSVNDAQMALDEVLGTIRGNESYPITIYTIGNQWDAQSRSMILNDPSIIPVIDGHVQSGIFEKIVTVMEKEKLLGRLNGVPDLVAYKQIGDKLDAEGAFNDLGQQNNSSPQAETKPTQKPAVRTTNNQVRNQRRKAAASNKSVPKSKAPAEFDPLAMSDEEFNKLSTEDYYR
jgi:hypothetical protein